MYSVPSGEQGIAVAYQLVNLWSPTVPILFTLKPVA